MNRKQRRQSEELLNQQVALAQFGEQALRADSLDQILNEACRLVGSGLRTDLAKIMELSPDGRSLRVRAGVGWKPGVVGHVTVCSGEGSAEGSAVTTCKPVVSTNILQECRFKMPMFLRDHDVKSLVAVVILNPDTDKPFGVLEVDSRELRTFTDDDIAFLQTYANILAAAVRRQQDMENLQLALEDRDKLFETNQQPLLVLDHEMTVKMANSAFFTAFRADPTDTLGHRIFDLQAGQWDIPRLHDLLDRQLRADEPMKNVPVEHEFAGIGRRIMMISANKVRRGEGKVDHLLLAIDDTTEREQAKNQLIAEKEFAEKTIDAMRESLLILDWDLRVQSANQPFYELFKTDPSETEGRMVYELADGRWNIPRLRELLDGILPKESSFDGYIVEHDFPEIGHRVMLLNGRKLDHQKRILLAIRDVTEERKADKQQKVLLGELQHRVKNILANVRALSIQTRRTSKNLDDFIGTFDGRIDALARIQDLVMRSPDNQASFGDLMRRELEAHGAVEGARFTLDGPQIWFPAHISQALVMVVHELSTNAIKHGALHTEGGRIEVRWSAEKHGDEKQFRFRWRERGMRLEHQPSKRGFGSEIIENSLPYMIGGTSKLTFHPDGAECAIEFPIDRETHRQDEE